MNRPAQKLTEEDPRRAALTKRCKDLNWNADQANLLKAATQMAGTEAGKAIILGCKDADTARRAYDAFEGYRTARERYWRTVYSMTGQPDTIGLEVEPEPFEVDAETIVDDRDDDEKERDARNAMAKWNGYFQKLSLGEQSWIVSMAYEWMDPVKDGRLTQKGRHFVAAAEKLADIVESG